MPNISNAAHAAVLLKWAETTDDTLRAFERWFAADAPADDGEPGSLTARQSRAANQAIDGLSQARMALYSLAASFQEAPDLPPGFKAAQLARLQGMLAELKEQQR